MTKIHNGSIINAALAEKVTCDAILLYQFWPERASIIASLETDSSVRRKQLKLTKFAMLPLPILMRCKRNCPKKIFTEENFSNLVSYLCYTYWKQSMKKYERNLFLWPRIDMRILRRLALKSQHYLLTNFPIKLHKINYKLNLENKFFKLGYTHHYYSHISEVNLANHMNKP